MAATTLFVFDQKYGWFHAKADQLFILLAINEVYR